jgi:ubiquinone/menaquinone biosynthesis C-methylase UbiE
MKNIDLIPTIDDLYKRGENIISFLKAKQGNNLNTIEDILISYDFQSGSYIKFVEENPEYTNLYTTAIAHVFLQLGKFKTILEVGVGEATTLSNLALKLKLPGVKFFGFDISWSRIHFGIKYLSKKNIDANLFVADLFNVPLSDSSIDIVYTSHSVEPNGGREKEAIVELYRVAKKYLILLEPTNEFANSKGKSRMKKNGYIQNLKSIINELDYNLIEYRPFDISSNDLNPTGIYIIKKSDDLYEEEKVDSTFRFCCPISKSVLKEFDDHFYSSESFISYPKIMGIPCLFPSYGILTSKHE